jgi:hypothetical protein
MNDGKKTGNTYIVPERKNSTITLCDKADDATDEDAALRDMFARVLSSHYTILKEDDHE